MHEWSPSGHCLPRPPTVHPSLAHTDGSGRGPRETVQSLYLLLVCTRFRVWSENKSCLRHFTSSRVTREVERLCSGVVVLTCLSGEQNRPVCLVNKINKLGWLCVRVDLSVWSTKQTCLSGQQVNNLGWMYLRVDQSV